jgi:spore maturation protein CgeB
VEALRGHGQAVQEFNLGDLLIFYDSAYLMTGTQSPQGMEQFRKAFSHEAAIHASVDRMICTIWKFQPEVIFIVSGFFLSHEMYNVLRRRGYKTVLLHTECPYEDGVQLERAARVDISLLNDPTNLESFRKASTHAIYMPHAYRPQLHRPGPPVPQLINDLSFVGTGYASRIKFFEAMNLDGLDVFLAGNWEQLDDTSPIARYLAHDKGECLDNDQATLVYRSSKCGINFYRREIDAEDKYSTQTGWAMGPREVEMAACGLFFIRDRRPESDEILGMLPAFSDPDEATDLVRWALANPTKTGELATKAREAIADRTFANHAKQVLALLDEL